MSDNEQVPPQTQTDSVPFETKTVGNPQPSFTPPTKRGGGFKNFYRENKYYFWAIIFGAVLIAVLSFFAFHRSPLTKVSEANVAINVDAPDSAPSGSEEVYKVTVQNNDSQKLVNLELELIYPQGVDFESSTPNPTNVSGTLFAVPDLSSGQNATVFVKTKISGNINDQKNLNIKLHYHYSNFNSEYIKEGNFAVRILASNASVELDGPTTANNAQLVIYTVNYQNNSDGDIANARVKLTYPAGFVFASANPAPSLGTDTWDITALPKGANGTIQIQGNFTSVNSGETKTAQADLLVLGQDGQYFTQNTSTFNTSISSLPLLVTQVLQPENDDNVIKPGDNLTFNVTYQNTAATQATGVNIEVDLDSKVVDLSSIRADGGQVTNSSIVWNASGISQLANLDPNESGKFSFSLKINNPATKDSSKNLTLVSSIKIVSNEYSSAFPGNQLTLKVSSPTSVGKGLSFISGQLPPKVGTPTNYKVTLSLTNSSNDFSSGVLTASVPGGMLVPNSFTPSETPNVQYDSSTGKITWNFGSLPANTGRFTAPKTLDFQVKLTPAASQVNQPVTLVKNISFTAKDIFTGQNTGASVSDVTTNDISGTNGYGNGQVQE